MGTIKPYPQGSILCDDCDDKRSLWLVVSEPKYFPCLQEYIVVYVSASQTPSHRYKVFVEKSDLEGIDHPIFVSIVFATMSSRRVQTKVGQISDSALQQVKQLCSSSFAFHEAECATSSPEPAHPQSIVLVDFPYADKEGEKLRPVVVVSTLDYFEQTKRITALMITSQEQKAYCETDRVILRWQEAGLIKSSAIRCRPSSLLPDRAYPIGQLQPSDFNEAMASLRQALGI